MLTKTVFAAKCSLEDIAGAKPTASTFKNVVKVIISANERIALSALAHFAAISPANSSASVQN